LGFFALKTAIKNKRKTSSLPDELVDAIEADKYPPFPFITIDYDGLYCPKLIILL